MAILHFVNCALLTYLPFLVIDQCYHVITWSSLWPVLAAYGATQFAKMLAFATFVPTALASPSLSFAQEVVGLVLSPNCSPAVVDLVAIVLLYRNNRSIRQDFDLPPYLIVGYAWGLGDALGSRLFPLWFNARGVEWTWDWLIFSLEANFQLVKVMAICYLIWLVFGRKRSQTANNSVQYLLIGLLVASHIVDWGLSTLGVSSLARVLIVGAGVLMLAGVTKVVFKPSDAGKVTSSVANPKRDW